MCLGSDGRHSFPKKLATKLGWIPMTSDCTLLFDSCLYASLQAYRHACMLATADTDGLWSLMSGHYLHSSHRQVVHYLQI